MNEEKPLNFIDSIIAEDLNSGKISGVITRFPPEPNGYLHIGHAKSICLNFGLAKKYNGKCNLRFDDTNPTKEDEEFCNAIIEDVKWLGFEGEILFSSDYFEKMYECAVLLINKGLAYIDDLSPEQMREFRGTLTESGKESKNRNRPKEENLKIFKDMRAGKYRDGELVLRAKIDMSSPNINMRDPIIYRVLHAKHHRSGDKWCVYPMYDFAHPIEDAVEKITHSICTLEFEDHRPLYDWVIDNCEFDPKPHQYEFARLNLTNTIMSKRYLKKLVDDKFVDGWDDPRMPTISGLRRRGYPAKAIREFCEKIGVAKANSEVDSALLEFCVREELNVSAKRRMAVLDPIEMIITNYNGSEKLDIEMKAGENAESRQVDFSGNLYIEREDFAVNPPPKYHRLTLGGFVRLKGAYIVKCDKFDSGSDGRVERVYCTIMENSKSGSDTSGLKVKGVIHWVDKNTAIEIQANKYSALLNDQD
ncbi:glutamine-trna ligase [Holotrichia oblita]|nr:glutamine-trna ligase [Holotrichia oblita]